MTIQYRKTYEVTGYTADADIYCVPCATKIYGPNMDQAIDREGNPVNVVFLGTETEYMQHCAECGEEVETSVINREPVTDQGEE